jgi:outer membrane receptor protein involved in Fe transport
VDLRHLGPERTLTLVNGHRMAPGDAFSAGGDMNFVPATLVKRVDILTGGASSAYGADAVSGVVNFVLDTEFEGVRGAVSWNGFQHNNSNDLAQKINESRGYTAPTGSTFNYGGVNFNLAVGGKIGGGNGHASAYIDYRDIGDIWKNQRDYTNCSVSALGATGPACGGSATWQYGRFWPLDGRLRPGPQHRQHRHLPTAQGTGVCFAFNLAAERHEVERRGFATRSTVVRAALK